jgi:hypothetical protein
MTTDAVFTRPTHAEPLSRQTALRTCGHSHGRITRLVSPGDIGERINPFVFLDHFDADPASAPSLTSTLSEFGPEMSVTSKLAADDPHVVESYWQAVDSTVFRMSSDSDIKGPAGSRPPSKRKAGQARLK